MASFTVVYDACLLYPASVRDLVVELARTGLFRAKWTTASIPNGSMRRFAIVRNSIVHDWNVPPI